MPAVNYQINDAGKIGAPGPGPSRMPATGYKTWAVSQTWAAGDKVQNGAFLFSTVAGGAGAASGNGPAPNFLTDNACTWVLVGGVTNLTVSDAVQAMDLGTSVVGSDPTYGAGEFMYVKFTGATNIVAGDFCQLNRATLTCIQAASGAITTGRGAIGVAMGSHALATATPTYGWIMVRGVHTHANIATGVSTNVFLYLSATPGRCAVGVVAGYSCTGAIGRIADAASNVGAVEVWWPACTGLG
jgi:hypothetical protein